MSTYSTYHDNELVALLKHSDEAAFAEIYNRYWKTLFYKAAKKLNDISEAESLVQDVFTDIWNRRTQLNITTALSFYLAGALRFKIINLQAAQQRNKLYIQHITKTHTEEDNHPNQLQDYTELEKQLSRIIATLPEKCKLVFQLKQQGYSQKEIAEQMQVSENTVETHIKRALKVVRAGISQLLTSLFTLLP